MIAYYITVSQFPNHNFFGINGPTLLALMLRILLFSVFVTFFRVLQSADTENVAFYPSECHTVKKNLILGHGRKFHGGQVSIA